MFHKCSLGLWQVAKQWSKKLCIPTLGIFSFVKIVQLHGVIKVMNVHPFQRRGESKYLTACAIVKEIIWFCHLGPNDI
jgi:hypothetical protein